MKITEIKFQNILSFNDFTWSDINEGLNVIVGPNGAGKSNIFIALNFLKDYLSNPYNNYNFNREYSWLINTDKKDADKCKICMDIEFDKNDEEDLFKYFFTLILQTAIMLDLPSINQEIFKYNTNNPTATLPPINQDTCLYKVLDKINIKFIDDFFKGTLIFEFDENNPSGLIYYIFDKSSEQIRLYLKGGQFSDSLIIGNQEPLFTNTPSAAIINFSSYNDLKNKIPEAYNQCMNHQEFSNAIELSFSFDEILNEAINYSKYNRISGLSGPNWFNPPSLNSAKELARALKFNPNPSSPPPSFISLFNHIIGKKIISLDNFRIPYKKEYPVNEIENHYPNITNGEDLALYLHKLRNGNREEKRTFTEINELFFYIAKARLDLRIQFLSENQNYNQPNSSLDLASSPIINNNKKDEVKFTILVTKNGGNNEIPLEYSGAGIQELVLLISLLKIPSSEGCILLLDEPAVNLHPIMQKKLLNAFKNIVNDKEQSEQNINKNQIFIISHSSHFIPKEKFSSKSVKRIYLNDSDYSAISSEIKEENVDNIISMLRMTNFSDNLISSLFAACVILCEGDNDYLALPIWFEKYKKGENSLHDYNLILVPLDGWERIEYAISFLESFNIPYVALLDPDTMLNGNKSIFKKLGLGIPGLSNKDEIKEAIETLKNHNIFIYGNNEDFKSSDGRTFRDIIIECLDCKINRTAQQATQQAYPKYCADCKVKIGKQNGKKPPLSFEELNKRHHEIEKLGKENGEIGDKEIAIKLAENTTNLPEEIRMLFDKALELAGVKWDK
jgi:predicted ATP-dependent endonuclease of OLD family